MISSILIFLLQLVFSNQKLCGNSVVASGFIVGGDQIKRGQWPFIAALFDVEINKYFCGATIISTRHVITAAHCLQQKYWDKHMTTSDITVHVGRYNISKTNESGSIETEIDEITVHPDWVTHSSNYDADLAILRTKDGMDSTIFIQIACWPGIETVSAFEGFVVGWGVSESTNYRVPENIAKQTRITSVSNEFCFLHQPELVTLSSIRTFCAGGNGRGPCHGDSGGGFFVKLGSNWFLRGIVSSSLFDNDGKCDVHRYTVFTNVGKFSEWVLKVVSEKIARHRFEYAFERDGKQFEAYSYRTDYHNLNGTSSAASSLSFKEV